jgi:hypothetical protein
VKDESEETMKQSDLAVTRAQDLRLEDSVHHSPVDEALAATHRRLLLIALPWAWCAALPWVLGAAAMQVKFRYGAGAN